MVCKFHSLALIKITRMSPADPRIEEQGADCMRLTELGILLATSGESGCRAESGIRRPECRRHNACWIYISHLGVNVSAMHMIICVRENLAIILYSHSMLENNRSRSTQPLRPINEADFFRWSSSHFYRTQYSSMSSPVRPGYFHIATRLSRQWPTNVR